MIEVRGDAGELIDRLIECCTSHDEPWAFNNLALLSAQIGLRPPGRPWQQDRYSEQVRQHLTKIGTLGLREHLLVGALRDALGRFWKVRADVEAADRQADNFREVIEHAQDNPVDYLGRFGDSVEEVAQWAAETLTKPNPLIRAVSADDAAQRWADAERWAEATQRLLSDEVLERWVDLLLRQRLREDPANPA